MIMTVRRNAIVALMALTVIVVSALPAAASHDHYIATPNGNCHQVASGQTSIGDPTAGGYHRFHDSVHTGAAAPDNKTLGHGHAVVEVYKGATAPSQC